MKDPNLFEDLVAVSPGMEIWWDSSPVIFGNWCEKMLAKADDADKASLKGQFARMYNTGRPDEPALPRRHHQPAALARRVQGRPAALGEGRAEGPRRQPGPRHRGPLLGPLQGGRQAGLRHVPPAVRGVGLQGGLPLRPGRPAQRVRRRGHADAGARDPRREPQRDGQGARHRRGLRDHRGAHLARHRHQQHAHLRALAAARLRQVGHARPGEGQGQRRRPQQVALGHHPHGSPLRRPRRPA